MATVQPFGLTFMESVPPQSVPAPLAGAVLDQQRQIATFNGRPLCELVGLDEEMNRPMGRTRSPVWTPTPLRLVGTTAPRRPRVLVLTAPVDPTADYVIQHLSTAGVPLARVDSADFPDQLTASAMIKPGGPWAVTLNDIDLDDVTAIYYRRPGRFVFSLEIPDPYLSWCDGQARYGFWSPCPFAGSTTRAPSPAPNTSPGNSPGPAPSGGSTTPSPHRSSKTSPNPNPARHTPPTYHWPPSRDYRSCCAHHPSRRCLRLIRSTPTDRRRSRCSVCPGCSLRRDGVALEEVGQAGPPSARRSTDRRSHAA